ncbi:MAG TPA: lysylphosphatidylglycerol synthase transmembrane domain-containing protein [Myxococcaceae bacterium]|nr:lysylphosphatidylglycerol synthase transmembrane domain-containing protein [Myxococcaceae bacterium]
MKRAVNLALSLAVTGVCTWWTFRSTNWTEQRTSLAAAKYVWIVPYLGVLAVIHLSRTLRWRALLSGLERVGFRAMNEASGIGFMMLIVLPFRLGEFARPFLIARRSNIRRSAAMTTVVLERITDGILVAVGLRALLFFVPKDAPTFGVVRLGANLMFGVFFSGLLFLLFALWQQERAVRLVRATLGRVSAGLADVAAHVVDTFVGAMRQLPSRGQLALFFAYTLVYWLANGAGMALLGLAFAGVGPEGGFHLDVFQGYVVMGCLVAGVMIPSAPGSFGPFQLAVVIGLKLFLPVEVAESAGLAFANVLWICQTAQQVGLGFILMVRGQLSFREITQNLSADEAAAAS